MGFVAIDPQEKCFDNDTRCVTFSIKTLDVYFKNEERKIEKNFHHLVVWNDKTERICELIKKGDLVYIEGKLKNRKIEYPDKRVCRKTEIVVSEWTKVPLDNRDYQSEDLTS